MSGVVDTYLGLCVLLGGDEEQTSSPLRRERTQGLEETLATHHDHLSLVTVR